jgi:ubiquinone biosynthesis protein
MEEFPGDLKNAIRKINTGQVKVDLTHKGMDPMVHTINRVMRQVVLSLIFAGLTVGSTLFIINDVRPHWGSVSAFGVIGIILAAYIGSKIMTDLRKGDHDDWKGWDDE